jgi:hypothetical protein
MDVSYHFIAPLKSKIFRFPPKNVEEKNLLPPIKIYYIITIIAENIIKKQGRFCFNLNIPLPFILNGTAQKVKGNHEMDICHLLRKMRE